MKTIITLDRANQPYGYPQLNSNGNFNSVIAESGVTATTLTVGSVSNYNLTPYGYIKLSDEPNKSGFIQSPYSNFFLAGNNYYNPLLGFLYDKNGYATQINLESQLAGYISFSTAPSGTAGSIVDFKTAMLITNNGNISMGSYDGTNTVPNKLTISAVTDPIRIQGLTANTSDTNLLSIDANGVVHKYPVSSISGGTSSGGTVSGAYLPLSGGTVTGRTIFTSGITANTISQTQYIDFTTGSTNPSQTGGRIFFDNTSKALSYYDVANNLVPIAMGQQLYTRVWNATGAQIDKGKVIAITGTSNGLPSAILAVNTHAITSARPIGLAAENIPNGSDGLVLNNGILSGITLNGFSNGDTLYLSDTTPGSYTSTTASLAFTARTNEIGYVLQTGSTTGKIYVNINNEDSNLSLTDKERNILEGNFISGGIYEYTGMTQGTGQTINVAYARGWVVRNTYGYATLPDVTNIYYTGGTNIPLTYLTTADSTYILINSGSTLVQQTSFPTPQQRRENIFLGKVVHPNRSTITSINNTVDFDVSPMAALRDLWTPIKIINQGVVVSYYSAGTMNIQTSAGYLWGNGIGWTTNQQNPDSVYISGTSPTTFQYRSRNGSITGSTGLPAAPTGNTTTIDSHHYDDNGNIVAVGANNKATNQRIYLFPTGLIRIQYGQQVYNSMALAIAGIDTEIFAEFSNNRDNGVLIGILTVREDASNLADTGDAQFRFVSKFGELLGGAGGISTTTLQQAYNNSATPEILTNSSEGPLSIKNGVGANNNQINLFEGIPFATTGATSFIRADGLISGSSVSAPTISATTYYGLPTYLSATSLSSNVFSQTTGGGSSSTVGTVIAVTGGTYSNGNIILSGTGGVNGTTITGLGGYGGGGQVYYLNLSNIQTPYREFSPVPTSAAQQSTGTSINSGVTSTLASFLTPSGYPNAVLLPGGVWSFYLHSYKANVNDNFSIYAEVYKRTSGGINTLLFSTDPESVNGVTPNAKMSLTDAYFSGTSLDLTDRILVLVKGTNNGTSASTLTLLTEGSQYYSYATTTFGSSSSSSSQFTGGTVSGATNFISGLTANTISATTYQNVNAVTGGTYNSTTGVITLSGTGNVNGNTITGISAGGGTTWQYAISPITASTGNGYITTGTTSIALPTGATLGSAIEVISASDNLFTITQNANQLIRFGIVTTTQGVGGSLVSQNNGDSIKLICTSANTVFTVVSAVGTITLN
jgi:hypothetical protein